MDWQRFFVNSFLFFILNPLLWVIFYVVAMAAIHAIPRMDFLWSIQ